MAVVEKSVKARRRHEKVAGAMRSWCLQNPKATLEEKIKQLDFLSDTAALDDLMKAKKKNADN